MRRADSWLVILWLTTGCAATRVAPRVLPPDPHRHLSIDITGADSAQVIDALGRRLRCGGPRCTPIPGATHGMLFAPLGSSGGVGMSLGPDIRPPLRLIVWAATTPSRPPPEWDTGIPTRPDWRATPFPQVILSESRDARCFKGGDVGGGVAPGSRCEWLLDIVPSDSANGCKITLKLLKVTPPKAAR